MSCTGTRPARSCQCACRNDATASQPMSRVSATGSNKALAVGSICQSMAVSPAGRSSDPVGFSIKRRESPSGRVQISVSRTRPTGSTQRIATKLSGRPWYSTRRPASASPASSTKCSHRPCGYWGDSISTWPSALLCACAQPVLSVPVAKKSSGCAVAVEAPRGTSARSMPQRKVAACIIGLFCPRRLIWRRASNFAIPKYSHSKYAPPPVLGLS